MAVCSANWMVPGVVWLVKYALRAACNCQSHGGKASDAPATASVKK